MIRNIKTYFSEINLNDLLKTKDLIKRDINQFSLKTGYIVTTLMYVDDEQDKLKEITDYFEGEGFNNFIITTLKGGTKIGFVLKVVKGLSIFGKINLYELYYCVHYYKYDQEELDIRKQCMNVMVRKTNTIKSKKGLRPLIMKILYEMNYPRFQVEDVGWFSGKYIISRV